MKLDQDMEKAQHFKPRFAWSVAIALNERTCTGLTRSSQAASAGVVAARVELRLLTHRQTVSGHQTLGKLPNHLALVSPFAQLGQDLPYDGGRERRAGDTF